MKVYLIDTTSLSPEEHTAFKDYVEKMSFFTEVDIRQKEKHFTKIFWDLEWDFYTTINIPKNCTCTDISHLDQS